MHRRVPLFNATMILLQSIVERGVPAVNYGMAQYLADGTRRGVMTIRRDPLGGMANRLEGLLEKSLGRVQISLLTQHGVNQVAVTVESPREGAPFSLDFHIRFINVPRGPCLSTSSRSKLIC
jgi:hypothetical protein